MEKTHKFDFKKLGEDLGIAGVISSPALGFGLYGYLNNWFARRKCVDHEWIRGGGGWGYEHCAEWSQYYSIPEFMLLALFSIVFAALFFYTLITIQKLVSAFLNRYMVCEEGDSEDNNTKSGKNE